MISSRKTSFLAIFALMALAKPGAAQPTSLFLTDAPTWLHYFCDGSEADPNGSASVQGAHCYQTLTVPSGATLTITALRSGSGSPQDLPVNAFFAFVTGACTIGGTITASGLNSRDGNGGGSGGSGGGASATFSSANGDDSALFGSDSAVRIAGGGAAVGPGMSGNNGVTPTATTQRFVVGDALGLGTFGGAGGGAGGGSSPAVAGEGGGGVALICGSINFTGSIDANGGNGAPGSSGGGGGGGGGGGVVLMVSPNFQANSGTISLSGGVGGPGDTGAGSGGSGGNGWSRQFVLQ